MLKGLEFKALRTSAGVGPRKAAEMMCLSPSQLRKIEREDLEIPESNLPNQYLAELCMRALDRLKAEREQWKRNNY